MKQPQIEDFATTPAALNKYSLGDMPSIEPRAKRGNSSVAAEQTKLNARTATRPNTRTPERANAPTGKRVIQRASFEMYQDQMRTLRRFSAEAMMDGEKGSMSEMVRTAVDEYIAKRKGK